MAQVYPSEITAADVASMLVALDKATPHLGEMGKVSFVLADPNTSPFPIVRVTPEGHENESSARRSAAGAIAVLPYLHEWVVGVQGQDEPNDRSDEHDLDLVEVNGEDVYVGYCARQYNSTWGHSFHKDRTGQWRHLGADSSDVDTPGKL